MEIPDHANIGRIDCGQEKAGRRYFLAWFVPAHQVIELEYYKHENAEPYRTRIPITATRRFN